MLTIHLHYIIAPCGEHPFEVFVVWESGLVLLGARQKVTRLHRHCDLSIHYFQTPLVHLRPSRCTCSRVYEPMRRVGVGGIVQVMGETMREHSLVQIPHASPISAYDVFDMVRKTTGPNYLGIHETLLVRLYVNSST